ncbi:MAG: sigma factor-like helix-turn-helix DNA-binding protein [Nanoarchaeota archaeon]
MKSKKGSTQSPWRVSSIPLAILRDRTVKVLESIVEYLKDVQGLTYHEIAELLNRDDRTIWTVYRRAKQKRGEKK